jgi:hypothetical protein
MPVVKIRGPGFDHIEDDARVFFEFLIKLQATPAQADISDVGKPASVPPASLRQ